MLRQLSFEGCCAVSEGKRSELSFWGVRQLTYGVPNTLFHIFHVSHNLMVLKVKCPFQQQDISSH